VKNYFSAARLKLYDYMKKVQLSPGCSVIYTDTDSVMFSCPRGKNPIPELVKKLVLAAYSENEAKEEDMPMFDYTRLGPNKNSQVLTTKMTKIYRCVNTKGYEHNSLIYPFGFE
jgi:hypothetical protein